ncbi:phospholipase C, phosphocholine-specific [Streptomyces actinomycinicus]|uniref:phospholipase C n=1 Tax=Streptomyces actinomycinicus TaxID=1695166 RepID=A0A937JQD0_9ACTN|nr:phospholipase C, phosphocholine-specific [Streptomyces actinomycinicus]MBL1086575.1 phospholipase C, phosphocholine-specific [Streptomyces actinomycinicus]
MVPIHRRQFLTGAAVAAATTAALRHLRGRHEAHLAASSADLTRSADPGASDLRKIEHVVILMQENRGFDHYFGTLQGVRGFGDKSVIDLPGTIRGPSRRTVLHQPDGAGSWRYPWALNQGGTDGWKNAQSVGTSHGWLDGHLAWNNGRLNRWIEQKEQVTMGYFTRADLPFHYSLADAFTICDAYHCSVLGPTGPNRNYLWSGSSGIGLVESPGLDAGDFEGDDQPWTAYAETLYDAGVSFKTYNVSDDNFGDNALKYFAGFDSGPLYEAGVRSVGGSGSTADRIIAAITSDVIDDRLARVSYVVTDTDHSEHSDSTPSRGAVFMQRLLKALSAREDVFKSTVLFITYDENDGFFDHVPPPVPDASYEENEWVEYEGWWPVGLGMRVPMIVVSPWTTGGRVCSQIFDHTSVIRFLEKWTEALGSPAVCENISAWRRKVCGDLTRVFDFTKSTSGYTLPALGPAAPAGQTPGATGTEPSPPADDAGPAQEAGTRKACALPYQTNAFLDRITVEGTTTRLWIAMQNKGEHATEAVHFSVYANAYRAGGPWQYTVDADAEEEDSFHVGRGYGGGKYDLTVTGPNRFMRRFTGDASKIAAGKHVTVRSSIETHPSTNQLAIIFHMRNHGDQDVTFRIKANQYRSWDDTYGVAAGEEVSDFFNQVASFNGWYDFTVTVDNDSSWSARFMGHIENGAPSITG